MCQINVRFTAIDRTLLSVLFLSTNPIFRLVLTVFVLSYCLYALILQSALEMGDFLDPLLDLLAVGHLSSIHQFIDIDVYFLLAKGFLGLESFLGSVGLPLLVVFDDLKVHMGSVDDCLEGVDGLCGEIDLSPEVKWIFGLGLFCPIYIG